MVRGFIDVFSRMDGQMSPTLRVAGNQGAGTSLERIDTSTSYLRDI